MNKLATTCMLCVFFFINVANADILECVGMDGGGKTIHLIFDSNNPTINVNGNILKITGVSKGGTALTTERFITTDGIIVYNSFGMIENKFTLAQFNAVTQKLIVHIDLSCHIK